jgi:hypothetical protein
MTIETLTDEKVNTRVKDGLKETLFRISSRKGKIFKLLDQIELGIVHRLAKGVGVPEEEIRSEIDRGKGNN